MDIKQLEALGAFAPRKLVKKTVKLRRPIMVPVEDWEDPEDPEFTGEHEDISFEVWLKRPSSGDQLAIGRHPADDYGSATIYQLVRNENGTRMFESVEQAKELRTWLAIPLIELMEGLAPKVRRNSKRATSSGSKSRSPSAAAARKNGKKRSPRSGGKS